MNPGKATDLSMESPRSILYVGSSVTVVILFFNYSLFYAFKALSAVARRCVSTLLSRKSTLGAKVLVGG